MPIETYFPVLDTDDCNPDPCNGRGMCIDGMNTFTCNCNAGYTGDKCETSNWYTQNIAILKVYGSVEFLHNHLMTSYFE